MHIQHDKDSIFTFVVEVAELACFKWIVRVDIGGKSGQQFHCDSNKNNIVSVLNFEFTKSTLSWKTFSESSPRNKAMFGDVIRKPNCFCPLHFVSILPDNMPCWFSWEASIWSFHPYDLVFI